MTSNMIRALVRMYNLGYKSGATQYTNTVDEQVTNIYNSLRAHDISIQWDKLKYIVKEQS